LMALAETALTDAVANVTPLVGRGVISNADGVLVNDGPALLDRLVRQVTRPVRWDLVMRTMRALGVTAAVELAPAGTLTGLLRRELPDVECVALRSPDDLTDARALAAEHGVTTPVAAPEFRLVVAPVRGTVRLPAPRAHVAAGDVLAAVATHSETVDVTATSGGRVIELLVADGDPVAAGQPLARLSAAVE
jgi:[acyl-carrier-protein] S-malonyltransferase